MELAFGSTSAPVVATEPEPAASFNTAMRQGAQAASVLPCDAAVPVLKSVRHGWDDHPATTIPRDCREVLPEHGRLLVVEPVLPDAARDAASSVVCPSGLDMLVDLGGRERTRVEFDALPGGSGFAVADAIPPAPSGFSLVQAVPA